MTDAIIFNLDDDGFKKLSERLKGATERQLKALFERIAGQIGVAAESYARVYPPVRRQSLPKIYTRDMVAGKRTRPFQSKFKSQAQAYAVLKKGEAGLIPSRRTGTLGKSITHRVIVQGDVYVVEIGTNVPYAEVVIGNEDVQSHYHQGNWTPLSAATGSSEAVGKYEEIIENNLIAAGKAWFG